MITIECPQLDIWGHGEKFKEALKDFTEYYHTECEHYANKPDSEFTKSGLEMKKKFMESI